MPLAGMADAANLGMSSETAERVRRMAKESVEEHRQLLAELRGVSAMVEGSVSPAPGDVARRLGALADQVKRHVQDEEASDFYRWLPEHFNELRDELVELAGQHEMMLDQVRRLSEAAEHAEQITLDSELGISIRKAIAVIREHEARESEMLGLALTQAKRPA